MTIGILMMVATMAAASPDAPYSYSATADAHGELLTVYMKIYPDIGWKWNSKYPAKYQIKWSDGESIKYDFTSDGVAGIIYMWEKTEENKPEVITLIASFSLCTEQTCKVFRNQEIKITLKDKKT